MIEEILQAGAEQVNNKDVVQPFLTKVVDVGNSSYTELELSCIDMSVLVRTAADQYLVCPIFISQLWSIALSRFLLPVSPLWYVAERVYARI